MSLSLPVAVRVRVRVNPKLRKVCGTGSSGPISAYASKIASRFESHVPVQRTTGAEDGVPLGLAHPNRIESVGNWDSLFHSASKFCLSASKITADPPV